MFLRRPALALSLLTVYALGVMAQQPPPKRPPEELLRLSLAAEKPGLAEPFTGITTNGRIESGLFPVRSTGVSTAAVRTAADAYLAGLTPDQRKQTVYPVDDPEWRKWMNQSFYVRQGASFLDMTAPQRELAFGLLRASLSARGLTQTHDIMRLNETLAELTGGNFDEYGEGRYHITVMGTPSATEPWGWQIDGHHAIVNYFVLGDQVVMTPHFFGSEPVRAESGKYKGTVVMQEEQNRGLAFINALDEPRRKQAVLSFAKERDNNLTEAWKDNVVLDYAGIRATALSDAQRTQLVDLIALYVGNMDDGHAKVKMADVRAQLDRTYFAWIGPTDANSVFYYRIHSPVILIEFDHQRPVGLRHLLDPSRATRQHIHAVVRTPNGNDYGKDLLRQHYLQHPHSTVTASPAVAGPAEEALQVVEKWAAAFRASDVDAIVGLYAPDALFLGTGSRTVVTEPSGIRQYFERALLTDRPRGATLDSRSVMVLSDGAVVITGLDNTTSVRDGKPLASPGRVTFVVAKRGADWKIVHFHRSGVPGRPN